jgi:hypothetical protein
MYQVLRTICLEQPQENILLDSQYANGKWYPPAQEGNLPLVRVPLKLLCNWRARY